MKGTPSLDSPHHVYRVFDAQGRLLYIGCTHDVNGRMAVHRAWGSPNPASQAIFLHGERVESVEFPDFATARQAERDAITAEAPYFNREHNPKRWARVGGEWTAVGGEYAPVRPPANPELLAVLERFGGAESRAS